MALCRGVSRLLLINRLKTSEDAMALVPWSLTLAATKNAALRLIAAAQKYACQQGDLTRWSYKLTTLTI